MRELKTIIGAALVVLILTGYSRIASAQEADAVFIAPFPEIRIIYENSIEYQGNLDSLNDEVLILSLRDGGTKSLKWESIKKIKTYRGKKSNQALIGGGLGFLGGGAVGLLLGGSSSSSAVGEEGADAIEGAKIGAISGLVIGTFLGLAWTAEKWETVPKESIMKRKKL